jgi:hypothetical protein
MVVCPMVIGTAVAVYVLALATARRATRGRHGSA